MVEEQENQENTGEAPQAAVADEAPEVGGAGVQPVEFGMLPTSKASGDGQNLDLLLDVAIPVSVEVGRAQMQLAEILDLVPGSIVSLDKKAEEPVDLRVNGKLVARGEVVLIDDNYGLRVTQIVDAAERIESLRGGGG